MEGIADMEKLRKQIDEIDDRFVSAFEERIGMAEKIANAKRENNLSIVDSKREEKVLENAVGRLKDAAYAGDVRAMMRMAMSLSKARQRRLLMGGSTMPKWVEAPAPQTVVFQGVPGAFGEMAAISLYPDIAHTYVERFRDVFDAVAEGRADVGVVPIENSSTGAIGDVYDLLRAHGCYIVAETRVPVRHNLMGLPGARVGQIKEVLSHPEGFLQSAAAIEGRGYILTPMQNTAIAAETVLKRGDAQVAAIASLRAAQKYGLEVLEADIQTNRSNSTRFIAVAKKPWLAKDRDRISITFHTQHRCGALADVLMCLAISGLNLTRIESRPLPGDEYRFFLDIEGDPADPVVEMALEHAATSCTYMEVLGAYKGAPRA